MKIKPGLISPASFKNAGLLLASIIICSVAFSQVMPSDTNHGAPMNIKKLKSAIRIKQTLIPEQIQEQTGLDPADYINFGEEAAEKTIEFDDYIQLIIKANYREDAYKSIDQACLLFSSEADRVEVSSLNTKVKNKYAIREYLNRLQQHLGHYDSIKISYAIVSYATHFRMEQDSSWRAVITLQQTFRGYVEGEVVYSDVTKKNVEIIARRYRKYTPKGVEAIWEVFLGDVGVVETRKLKL